MEFYKSFLTLYNEKGERIARRYCGLTLLETTPENTIDTITWDNLSDYYTKYGVLLPFSLWYRKKGRLISFFSSIETSCPDIKEWKTDLNLTLKHDYMKDDWVSIEDVLKWHDIDKAIQYLKEHGLSISM